LLAHAADVNSANGMGQTLLHLAARLEKHDTFDNVIRRCDLLACDKDGNTVMHVLAYTQNARMIGRVLDAAPELLQKKNHRGLTPLGELAHVANRRYGASAPQHLEAAARMMLLYGADANAQDE